MIRSGRPARPVGFFRACMLLGIGVAGFGVAAVSLAPRIPPAYLEPTSAKLDHVLAADPPCDVLFFGSSHTLRGVKPAVFDRRSERLGHPARSFNFGVAGSRWLESDATLRRTLAALESPPSCVFVEVSTFSTEIEEANARKPRVVAWHDRDSMPVILASVRGDRTEDHFAKLDRYGFHLMHFGMNELRVGDGPRIFEDRSPPEKLPMRLRYIPREQGYADFSKEKSPRARRRHERFLARIESYEAMRKELVDDQNRLVPMPPWFAEAILRQAASIEALGTRVVYYVPPSHRKIVDLRCLTEAGFSVVRFDDPERYPELYDPGYRHDHAHLNDAGAKIFSRELASVYAGAFSTAP